MTQQGSLNSKLQAPKKFQIPNLNGSPWIATTSLGPCWSLRFGACLEFGAWSLVL